MAKRDYTPSLFRACSGIPILRWSYLASSEPGLMPAETAIDYVHSCSICARRCTLRESICERRSNHMHQIVRAVSARGRVDHRRMTRVQNPRTPESLHQDRDYAWRGWTLASSQQIELKAGNVSLNVGKLDCSLHFRILLLRTLHLSFSIILVFHGAIMKHYGSTPHQN